MPVFRPFRAIRPVPDKAKDIASLPYDVMNSEEAREEVKKNPLSYIHVEKAEVDLPEDIDHYAEEVYQKAKENLYNYVKNGHMAQDDKPMFYVYREIMGDVSQTGLVGCTAVDDYMNNLIKKHELTRAAKEADRIKHVYTCAAHASPVFFTYPHKDEIDAIVKKTTDKAPEYDFVADDGVKHTLWLMNDEKDIDAIQKAFQAMPYLYVADGHHRTASAAKVGLTLREENPNYTGEEEFNFFMAVIFPDNQLYVMDYNRVVKDLHGHSAEEYFELVKKNFIVEEIGKAAYKPEARHTFGMFINGIWYKLSAKEGSYDANDPVKALDVSILQDNLLAPILGIGDPRTDERIDFIGGIRGLKELEKRVNNGERVAFSMFPTSMQELMDIADAGQIMPPKSTWFEPKLRSGLFIHPLH
ncbi:MAG: DUF1015 domain-containing protein [Candidatus Cloacimonetes bacterium]|nr:DUF1015 domain-containing protein [Candidatus Cloacimonadota bacterium]